MAGCIEHTQQRQYGTTSHRGCKVYLHRLSYCTENHCSLASIAGKVVRHTCDNPRCINGKHLVLGTTQDNMDDRAERNRTVCGSSHGKAKLTEEVVSDIRAAVGRGAKQRDVAAVHGLHESTVSQIILGKTWTKSKGVN